MKLEFHSSVSVLIHLRISHELDVPKIAVNNNFLLILGCKLGDMMYQNEFTLVENDYCINIQCVNGKWENKGTFNSACKLFNNYKKPNSVMFEFD